jgi:acyl-CoA thioester hydrolase
LIRIAIETKAAAMAKPDPALLTPARYPFHCVMPTRFGDLDLNMHVNNVAMAGILEDGRVRFHRASGAQTAMHRMGIMAMVASSTIDYIDQAYYPDPLEMHAGAAALGRTSYQVVQLVTQGTRVVACSRVVMVCVADGKPAPLPDTFRQNVTDWLIPA